MSRIVIIGAGIVGLAVARELADRGYEVTVLEKEAREALHQTGRNSGVIHSGLYYKPGSFKAKMAVDGAQSMRNFAERYGIDVDICGKLVVASSEQERDQLVALHRRGRENGVPCRVIDRDEARSFEPHVASTAALRVESTGIVDYAGVCRKLVELIIAAGGVVRFHSAVTAIFATAGGVRVQIGDDFVEGDFLVNCAGLYSDRVAAMAKVKPSARIIPFRGEYFELRPEAEHLVNGLVYPVPDPRFPFLGVHLTKMVKGGVHAGPNAVFAFAREGYSWSAINLRELWGSATWPGLWKLGAKFAWPAWMEFRRSLSKDLFAESLQRLVPEVAKEDLVASPAGVRAQAMFRNGSLVDDFLFEDGLRQIHVLNAPSPAATAAFEIARHIADRSEALLNAV